MNRHVLTQETNRREMLKLSGLGVLGGVAANALIPSGAQAAPGEVEAVVAYASWIHGHSMHVEYPDRIASERRWGGAIEIEGKPGTDNWFHFAIPTPVIINNVRPRIDSVLLCFRTFSADAVVQHVHVWDGDRLVAQHDDLNLTGENPLLRLAVPADSPYKGLGIGISIGVGFGVEMMEHRMEFISVGCDFVTQGPV